MLESWSWVRALEEGKLTPIQYEALQALVDADEAESLAEAAQMLDLEVEDEAADDKEA